MFFRTHGRAIVACIAAVLTALASAITDGHIFGDEKAMIGVAVINAIVVYIAPNYPNARWIKAGCALALTVLDGWVAVSSGGVTHAEMVNLIVMVLVGLGGVAVTPSLSVPEGGAAPAAGSLGRLTNP